jgi:hypothetical protein
MIRRRSSVKLLAFGSAALFAAAVFAAALPAEQAALETAHPLFGEAPAAVQVLLFTPGLHP